MNHDLRTWMDFGARVTCARATKAPSLLTFALACLCTNNQSLYSSATLSLQQHPCRQGVAQGCALSTDAAIWDVTHA
eukprot:1161296-Pelagomonas_calceolata.AAC.12